MYFKETREPQRKYERNIKETLTNPDKAFIGMSISRTLRHQGNTNKIPKNYQRNPENPKTNQS